MNRFALCAALALACASTSLAHDLWFETSTAVVPAGYPVQFQVKVGHIEDKEVYSPDLSASTFFLLSPKGQRADLGKDIVDVGYVTGSFSPKEPGIYILGGVLDMLVPEYSVRVRLCGKLIVRAADRWPIAGGGGAAFSRPAGLPLEFLPESDPTALRAGKRFSARLVFNGKPCTEAELALISRNPQAKRELKIGPDGRVEFALDRPGWVMLVADHREDSEKGEGYEATAYTTSLPLFVCP